MGVRVTGAPPRALPQLGDRAWEAEDDHRLEARNVDLVRVRVRVRVRAQFRVRVSSRRAMSTPSSSVEVAVTARSVPS